MRGPSKNLLQLLTSLNLATEQEVTACDKIVAQLSQNLPDFDSVWIDALVQRRVITPWQADCLNGPHPHQLRVGNFLKTEPLGRDTFHAVAQDTRRQVVLHGVAEDEDRHDQSLKCLEHQLSAISKVRDTAPTSLALPQVILHERDSDDTSNPLPIYAASSFVPGWPADELLIRGGRIPWQAVAEIGQQLLEASAWLEHHNLVHGEITLKNVRLTTTGETILVSPLLNATTRQGVSLTSELQLRDVEFIAPERVGTGNAADQRSELYSLGCVLWQLLTARPAFLNADPVNRVLATQKHDVIDVRQLVPDVPDWLARLLQSMTRRSPELRISSAADALQQWQQNTATGHQQTRRLLSKLPDRSMRRGAAPTKPGAKQERFASIAVATVMIAFFAGYGIHSGLLPQPLRIGGVASDVAENEAGSAMTRTADEKTFANAPATHKLTASGLHVLPQPDVAGVVLLQSGLAYEASDLQFVGVMHIETTSAGVAQVQTSPEQPWRLAASQISIQNVEVRSAATPNRATDEAGTGIECVCDILSIRDCRIDSGRGKNRDRSVLWTPGRGNTSVVSVSNTAFHGSGYGLWMTSSPQRCEFTNVLITNQRAGVRCDVKSVTDTSFNMNVDRVTQTGGLNFLDTVVPSLKPSSLRVRMTCGESVMAVSGALVQVAAPKDWPLNRAFVECLLPPRGNPTIVPPGVRTAVGFDSGLNAVVALQDSQIRAEALLIAEPIFRGVSPGEPTTTVRSDASWQLLDFEGPKLSQQMPGVDVTTLPQRFATVNTAGSLRSSVATNLDSE